LIEHGELAVDWRPAFEQAVRHWFISRAPRGALLRAPNHATTTRGATQPDNTHQPQSAKESSSDEPLTPSTLPHDTQRQDQRDDHRRP
jgi:hypothetical protein